MAKVILRFGQRVIGEIPLAARAVTIGRNPGNDIRIDNPSVSGFHGRIEPEGEGYFIEDMNSLNGTFLNGEKITRAELEDNAEITIGKHTLVFVTGEFEPAQARPDATPLGEKTMLLETRKHREMSRKPPVEPQPLTGGKVGVLTVVDGPSEVREYELSGPFATIGKAMMADIRIKGLFAPEIAALVQRSADGYFISPPERGRKPRINGNPVEMRIRLKEGDVLEAGGVKMCFFLRDAKEQGGE